ncbi:hypothetical protein KJY73_18015 [Bowmanella sp. Y26]|uniref:hypothetical protein n=1 Tax=Bowmanella yangjiangensis TaxID=2811230 RepID=UPI001BDD605D|nr:hypothetical protein [Bowmanella yangjiangensis]MBT1065488.1 hypothetical protein [Bowmanella yangjiangensis]
MSDEDKIDKLVRSAKVAHMSNAKWRKLFFACEEYPENIGGVLWKFLDWDRHIECSICATDALLDDERFGDCSPAPYVSLREIEWIFIPAVYSNRHADAKRPLPNLSNDLRSIQEHLLKYSQFPLSIDSTGIRIVGYEW